MRHPRPSQNCSTHPAAAGTLPLDWYSGELNLIRERLSIPDFRTAGFGRSGGLEIRRADSVKIHRSSAAAPPPTTPTSRTPRPAASAPPEPSVAPASLPVVPRCWERRFAARAFHGEMRRRDAGPSSLRSAAAWLAAASAHLYSAGPGGASWSREVGLFQPRARGAESQPPRAAQQAPKTPALLPSGRFRRTRSHPRPCPLSQRGRALASRRSISVAPPPAVFR